jgi:hypothetical protein
MMLLKMNMLREPKWFPDRKEIGKAQGIKQEIQMNSQHLSMNVLQEIKDSAVL